MHSSIPLGYQQRYVVDRLGTQLILNFDGQLGLKSLPPSGKAAVDECLPYRVEQPHTVNLMQ